jgi:hypothetical protein
MPTRQSSRSRETKCRVRLRIVMPTTSSFVVCNVVHVENGAAIREVRSPVTQR